MPPISTVNKIAKIFNGDKQIVKIFAGDKLIYKLGEGGSDMPPATGLIYAATEVRDGLNIFDKTLTLQGTQESYTSSYRPGLVGIYPNGDYVGVWKYFSTVIRRYSSNNDILWTSVISDEWIFPPENAARALVNSNGDILIYSRSGGVSKIDGTDGSIIWSKSVTGSLYGDTFKIDKEDNFYTLDGSLLRKWDTNGDAIWSVTLDNDYSRGTLFIDRDYNVYASVNTLSYYKCDKNGQNGSYTIMEGPSASVYGFLIDEVNGYIYTSTGTALIQRDLNGDIIWTTNLESSLPSSHYTRYRAGIDITEDYKVIVGLHRGLNIFTTEGVKTGLAVAGINSTAYYNPNVQPWADNS